MKFSLVVLGALAMSASAQRPVNLAPVSKQPAKVERTGGGADDLLSSTQVMSETPNEAAREGAMRQTIEVQRLQGTLPTTNAAGVAAPAVPKIKATQPIFPAKK